MSSCTDPWRARSANVFLASMIAIPHLGGPLTSCFLLCVSEYHHWVTQRHRQGYSAAGPRVVGTGGDGRTRRVAIRRGHPSPRRNQEDDRMSATTGPAAML